MLPKTYNLVAVPSFGAAVAIACEFTPYRINPTSGELEYGTPDSSLSDAANTDTPVNSGTKDNATEKMYGFTGVLSCDPAASATGTIDLYLVTQEASLTSDNALSEPLASISFNAESAQKQVSFEK